MVNTGSSEGNKLTWPQARFTRLHVWHRLPLAVAYQAAYRPRFPGGQTLEAMAEMEQAAKQLAGEPAIRAEIERLSRSRRGGGARGEFSSRRPSGRGQR